MAEKILFVDDEPNVLQSIQRQLHKRFPLQIAEGGEEALRILGEEGPFAVIVSDMRMPKMSGVDLLARVKDLYPDMVRLMLTGNADQETAMEAVNTGQIFRFLTKPCPPAVFITALALALRQHRLLIAEKELLQKTLRGCINVLSELLGVANPLAFSSGLRIREYVVTIAASMELPHLWQYEVAALMSQIGCVTLPGDILNKIYAGQELNQDETTMYENHPLVGKSLLENIPRLENVTRMIELQQKRFDAYTKELTDAEFEEILVGAQILKVAIDFDRQLFQGKGSEEILQWLRRQEGCYNPMVLAVLGNIKVNEREQILHLTVDKIGVGMVAVDDIRAKNGVLVIPKGQRITWPLLQGLKNFSMQVGVVEPIRVQVGQPSASS